MTQEEKARRYDEALDRAKSEWVSNLDNAYKNYRERLEIIFPELVETEDERIKNKLIKLIKMSSEVGGFALHKWEADEMVAWLEKQDKETSWKPSKEEMDVLYGLAYITNQYDEHKEEVITRLYQDLKREFFNGSSYENMFPNTEDGVRRRSTIQVLEYARSLDNYNQYGKADIDKNIAWLEKQGEQKPADKVEPKFRIGDIIEVKPMKCHGKIFIDKPNKIIDITEESYILDDGRAYSIELQDGWKLSEQKPADKVEPKFKVGNWIINKYMRLVMQILNNDNGFYKTVDTDGIERNYSYDFMEHNFKLWNIKDAKKGDVIYLPNGNNEYYFFIFKGIENAAVMTFAHFYQYNDGTSKVEGTIDKLFSVNDVFQPATKEQHDILFAKMKEAGYEWDEEKKELKKIEQKLAWSEEDKDFMYDTLSNLTELKDRYGDGYGKVGKCID